MQRYPFNLSIHEQGCSSIFQYIQQHYEMGKNDNSSSSKKNVLYPFHFINVTQLLCQAMKVFTDSSIIQTKCCQALEAMYQHAIIINADEAGAAAAEPRLHGICGLVCKALKRMMIRYWQGAQQDKKQEEEDEEEGHQMVIAACRLIEAITSFDSGVYACHE